MARLTEAMASHPAHAGVQHFALSILQNVAEDGGAVPLSQVRDPSVLRLVARALACHPDDEDVGNAALGLLASMAAQVKAT